MIVVRLLTNHEEMLVAGKETEVGSQCEMETKI